MQTIILEGARGGHGTTTTAIALGAFLAKTQTVQVVCDDTVSVRAVTGRMVDSDVEVLRGLSIVSKPSGDPDVRIFDGGFVGQPRDLHLTVLRGPSYLGLASLTRDGGLYSDGVILVAEDARALSVKDVVNVLGVPVVATVKVTAEVARSLDAGVFLMMLDRDGRNEFKNLCSFAEKLFVSV